MVNLTWKSYSGRTNGKNHTLHHAIYQGDVKPCIFEADDIDGVVLTVNGYRFQCATVGEAKAEAEERITNNRGVYIPYF